MAEAAAHLVDHVLPAVPMRQWVLSLPFPLRYRLAYDCSLVTPLLAAFLRAVFASLKRRAREAPRTYPAVEVSGSALRDYWATPRRRRRARANGSER